MREIVAFETMHVHPPCPIWSPNRRPFTFYVHTKALKTTRQRGACRENTERGQPGGGKDNANSHPAASNGKIKTRERAYRKKKERGNTPDSVSWAMSEMGQLFCWYREREMNLNLLSASCASNGVSDNACTDVAVRVAVDPLIVSSDHTGCDRIDGGGGVSSSCC
jgi:hypothetical protein